MKRTQNYDASENHGRYIASAELANLRGVSAVPVSFRAAALLSAAKRDFIWWLQGLSLTEGGFRRVARELLEMFPERIGTDAMHKAKVKPGKTKIYSASLEPVTRANFLRSYADPDEPEAEKVSGDDLIEGCRRWALTWRERKPESWQPPLPLRELSLEQFLVELCINPKVTFSLSRNDEIGIELETEVAIESDPKLSKHDFEAAKVDYFQDIIGALIEYRAAQEKAVRDNFYLTEIGRTIWQTLDFGLSTRGMVLVYGREGRGKTEAVKAWAQLHAGQARFVSLKGIATKTAMFREIATTLGVTYAYNRTGPEMQAKVEDVLKRSKIMLVIDEAHFLFNQSQRTKSRPELIDWLDTAVANSQIPLALCTTPQFIDCMARAAYQVEWNYNQFRRRVKRWIPLPDENTEADIAGVAAKAFAGANAAVIKKVISYVFSSGRDLSALGDVATELRELLGASDFSNATFKQVDQIIRENLYPSDNAFLTEMENARRRLPKGQKRPAPALPISPDPDQFEPGESATTLSAPPVEAPKVPGSRHRHGLGHRETALETMPGNRLEAVLTAH